LLIERLVTGRFVCSRRTASGSEAGARSAVLVPAGASNLTPLRCIASTQRSQAIGARIDCTRDLRLTVVEDCRDGADIGCCMTPWCGSMRRRLWTIGFA
jgi:hypothetical protein